MSQPEKSQNLSSRALHAADRRTWTRIGTGVEVFVAGRHEGNGTTAMFQRIRKTDVPELEAVPHTHIADCQTVVMDGEVEISFGSDDVHVLKAGDYLRVPAGTPHVQSVVSDRAEVFVLTDGDPGIEFVVPERWNSK